MKKNQSKKNTVLKNILICALAVSTIASTSVLIWKLTSDNSNPDEPVIPPTPDPDPDPDPKVVYHWVVFESNGGSHIDAIEVLHNSFLDKTKIANPTKFGYDFVAWCIDEELTTPFDFYAPIQDNLMLFAKYNNFGASITLDVTIKKDDWVTIGCDQHDIYVDWGDDSSPDNKHTHTYEADAKCVITIKGDDLSNFRFQASNKNVLTGITLANIFSIAPRGFAGCNRLIAVVSTDDSRLYTIGDSAFEECLFLAQVNIPITTSEIKPKAFYSCRQLKTVEIAVNGNNRSSLNIINKQAFAQCHSLTNINIPSSVVKIEEEVFFGCEYLQSGIVIPDDTISIGTRAFFNCCRLSSLTIGKNSKLETIGDGAFYNCSGITTFTTPTGLTEIGSEVFMRAVNLSTVNILDNITKIGRSAFEDCMELQDVNFDASGALSVIGVSAFKDCANLRVMNFPNNVKTIEESAFQGCSTLHTINFDIERSLLTTIGNYAFKNSSLMDDIYFPDSLISIGESAFEDCATKTITFSGDNLKTIGVTAFKNCLYLNKINGLPSSIEHIGASAFEGVGFLNNPIISEHCYYADSNKSIVLGLDTTQSEYVIDSNCVVILENAFKDCTNLTSITIPDSVRIIGYHAFDGCINLTTVNISSNSKLVNINDYAFYNCSSLQSINIPDTTKTIGSHAFDSCKSLDHVDISNSSQLSSIGSYAFNGCCKTSYVGLKQINIPKGVTSFEDYVFSHCDLLESDLNIHKDVTRIGEGAFYYCKKLKITIEAENSKLNEIDDFAFCYAGGVSDFTIPSSVTKFGISVFNNSSLSSVTFYENLKDIPTGAFGYSKLVSINIPRFVTSIGSGAFRSNRTATTLTFENNSALTTISEAAFMGCTEILKVKLPNSVKSLGGGAFDSCKKATFDFTDFTTIDSVPAIPNTKKETDNPFYQISNVKFYVYSDEMKEAFLKNEAWDYYFDDANFVVGAPSN